MSLDGELARELAEIEQRVVDDIDIEQTFAEVREWRRLGWMPPLFPEDHVAEEGR